MIFFSKEKTTDTIILTFALSCFAVGGLSKSRLEVVKKKKKKEEEKVIPKPELSSYLKNFVSISL